MARLPVKATRDTLLLMREPGEGARCGSVQYMAFPDAGNVDEIIPMRRDSSNGAR